MASLHPNRFAMLMFGITLAAFLGACDMMSGREDAQEYVNDASITTRVKSDLMRTRTMQPQTQIHVTTFKGQVTLGGQVDSRSTANKAIAIARAVPSVTGVKDEMEVRGETRNTPAPVISSYDSAPSAAPNMRPPITGTGYPQNNDGSYISPYRDSSPGNAGR